MILEAHIEGLRELYKEKFMLMMAELDKISPDLMTYIRPAGGYFYVVNCQMLLILVAFMII
jgi:DNA-binding transcriptional MocR family regulator